MQRDSAWIFYVAIPYSIEVIVSVSCSLFQFKLQSFGQIDEILKSIVEMRNYV